MTWRRGAGGVGTAVVAAMVFAAGAAGQMGMDTTDREAIVATALDYIEGWYEANPDRMARAVHDDLAKRIAMPGPDGVRRLRHMGKWRLVDNTRRNRGQGDVDLRDQVKILDTYGGTAMVRVDADSWVDFLQIAKVADRWVIVNVLWELRPEAERGR